MKGKYDIKVSNNKVEYQITVARGITVIKGDSATGKSTLIKLLTTYKNQNPGVKVSVTNNVNLFVFDNSSEWDYLLSKYPNSIVFMDEMVKYGFNKNFQLKLRESGSYLVYISRKKSLNSLNFGIDGIRVLKTIASTHKKTLIKDFPLYKLEESKVIDKTIVTEDSNSGMEMIRLSFDSEIVSARGNSRVYESLRKR